MRLKENYLQNIIEEMKPYEISNEKARRFE